MKLVPLIFSNILSRILTVWLVVGLSFASVPRCGFIKSLISQWSGQLSNIPHERTPLASNATCHDSPAEEGSQSLPQWQNLSCECSVLSFTPWVFISQPIMPLAAAEQGTSFELVFDYWKVVESIFLEQPFPPPKLA